MDLKKLRKKVGAAVGVADAIEDRTVVWTQTARKVNAQAWGTAGLFAMVELVNPILTPQIAALGQMLGVALAPSLGEPVAQAVGTLVAAALAGLFSRWIGWRTPEPATSVRG